MSKARIIESADNNPPHVVFYCEGCHRNHVVPTTTADPPPATPCLWYFNGNVDHPTIKPSLRVFQHDGTSTACHVVVTDGIANFCADSAHTLAGQSVPLKDCTLIYEV